jgi:hypothetical protein
MNTPFVRKLRCAVYTRKSSEEGLEQEFNSLHAQREACDPTSPANGRKNGCWCAISMMTAACLAARWNAPA